MKSEGNTPSFNDLLTILVIGTINKSIHDLSMVVGMRSRLHVPFEEDIIIFLTSFCVAGLKQHRGQLTSLGSNIIGTLIRLGASTGQKYSSTSTSTRKMTITSTSTSTGFSKVFEYKYKYF